jgi:hypothetical protein
LPSKGQETQKQTDRRDLWSTPLRWAGTLKLTGRGGGNSRTQRQHGYRISLLSFFKNKDSSRIKRSPNAIRKLVTMEKPNPVCALLDWEASKSSNLLSVLIPRTGTQKGQLASGPIEETRKNFRIRANTQFRDTPISWYDDCSP